MKYCFGPVPSRRLGLSFGVDILPHKTCNLSCIYCELGRTSGYTCERAPYVPTDDIKRELEQAILTKKVEFDCLTFTASGEPTLHTGLGELLDTARSLTDKPLVVLTNGTLAWMEEVKQALLKADILLPSLDAANPRAFRRVNRPAKCVVLDKVINGLSDLRKAFEGEFWLEVLLVKGINHGPTEISALKQAIDTINPHRVQLNTVARPPAEHWAKPLSSHEMERIKQELGPRAEIILDFKKKMSQGYHPIIKAEVLEILARRPMTLTDLSAVTGLGTKVLKGVMDQMLEEGKISVEVLKQRPFYILNSKT